MDKPDYRNDDEHEDNVKIVNKLKTTTLSTAYNIALQISLRILSFVVNAFILRFITKETLGIINVRLLLLYTTIQFISREPTRRTCASGDDLDDDPEKWPRIINIAKLTIPLSILIGFMFSFIWYWFLEQPPQEIIWQYQWAIISIYFSVIIESLAETCFIYGQRNDYIRLKVFIECLFQMIRCSLLAGFVYVLPENSILGFAIAQISASLVYTLGYYGYFVVWQKISSKTFFTWSLITNKNFDSNQIKTWLVFLKNSIIKQFLTEGERYIMTMFSVINFAEQGVYDVINNLGSLPARLIFQQIEENSYLLFSNLIKRDLNASQQKPKLLRSLYICSNLVKLMLLIGLMLFVYGYHCSSLALYIYGGANFVLGPTGPLAVNLFQWQCIYIVLVALNGILESYTFAARNSDQLNWFNRQMFFISIIFTISSLLITNLAGSVGFIIANCLNMLTRIIISLWFIGNILPQYSLQNFYQHSKPSILSWISFLIIFLLLDNIRRRLLPITDSQISPMLLLMYIGIVGCLTLIHLACLYCFESGLINFVKKDMFSLKKIKSKSN